jgi:hypothetical protein
MRRSVLMVLPLSILAGCGGSPNDPGEGGVTRAEADALDQAAAQLDASSARQTVGQPTDKSAK